MSVEQNPDFVAGDIIEMDGETYQVLENLGNHGLVRSFPSEEIEGVEFTWIRDGVVARKMGNAQLPAPTPCSATGSCPTDGKLAVDEQIISIDQLKTS